MCRHVMQTVMLLVLVGLSGMAWGVQAEKAVDLSSAVIVPAAGQPVQAKAAEMLRDEIEQRAGIRLVIEEAMPGKKVPAILLGTVEQFPANPGLIPDRLEVPEQAEGYGIAADLACREAPTVFLVGRDDRGALFAAGRLIRELTLGPGEVTVGSALEIETAPAYPMRGHQIGYRDTANSYDAWDVAGYEQYLRDLAIFGNNAIELIPELDRELVDGPVMRRRVWDMTMDLSEMIGSYGLDVWVWLALEGDVSNPAEAEQELQARREFFAELPYVDEVMVPGGDPGHTAPEVLMPFLEKMAAVLKESHPEAGLWVSNQGFEHEQNDYFFTYLAEHDVSWLGGIVYGPWTKMSLPEMYERTPKGIKIRRYPDITHTLRCQYPIPEWDQAFARALGREPICPRPRAMRVIHNLYAPMTEGFVSYSDGMHDDFNKVAWNLLGWDPETPVEELVKTYADVFFGDAHAEAAAKGLLMLEENWVGPLAGNPLIAQTLKQWEDLAKDCGDQIETNWRLQLYLFRATYDAYQQEKLAVETGYEEEARAALAKAGDVGVVPAIDAAKKALAQIDETPAAPALRAQLERLGLELMKSVGFQLSIEPPYRAKGSSRGAVLDYLDVALNDRGWLEGEFEKILAMSNQDAQLERIATLLNWEDPGPGGFYDNLGVCGKQPHLVRQKAWEEDPGRVESPREGQKDDPADRNSWLACAETLYGTPLVMRYEGLDPNAEYRLRVTYAGRYRAVMRLVADGQYEIHAAQGPADPQGPKEFDIPKAATSDGELELSWELISGRGCQVAEVWLIKKQSQQKAKAQMRGRWIRWSAGPDCLVGAALRPGVGVDFGVRVMDDGRGDIG